MAYFYFERFCIDNSYSTTTMYKKKLLQYKGKLDDLRISPCEISLNWETTKLLMDDDERKYYKSQNQLEFRAY